jgi:hypothetical protein
MLSFRNLLLPTLVTDRSHIEEFAPNFGVLLGGARMSRTVRRKPVTGFCLRIDDFLPILWSVHHGSNSLKQGDDETWLGQAQATALITIRQKCAWGD